MDNKMYSRRFLESLSENSLLILMDEHGYEEGYKGLSREELIEQLSNIEL